MPAIMDMLPHVPNNDAMLDTASNDLTNDTNTTTIHPISTTPEVPLSLPGCEWILYKDIGHTRVRIWDVMILVPNALFLFFLLIKARVAIVKLKRTSSPIFLAFYGLVFVVAVISVLRVVVSMTVNATSTAGDYADRILWLVLRFFLLATELSVVIFGLAFGHLDSRTSIQRVLLVTFSIALIYSCTQGVLEFLYADKHFHVKTDKDEYQIFGHGGMLFWFASSVFFFVVYTVICILPCTNCQQRFAMPTKKSFYFYCFVLSTLNILQATGSGMLYYEVPHGMCLVDVSTYSYFTCFAPLVYGTFLWDFFRNSQPPDILFSYKAHIDDEDEDTVHLPRQGQNQAHSGENDLMTRSYDSTQIDMASPNPLYSDEFHFSPELTINADYFREEIHDDDDNIQGVVT